MKYRKHRWQVWRRERPIIYTHRVHASGSVVSLSILTHYEGMIDKPITEFNIMLTHESAERLQADLASAASRARTHELMAPIRKFDRIIADMLWLAQKQRDWEQQ